MKTTIACAIAFAAGVAVGTIGAWQLLKTKYEQIAQDRIDEYYDSIKDALDNAQVEEDISEADEETIDVNEDNANKARSDQEKPGIQEYVSKLDKFNYSTLTEEPSEPAEPEVTPYAVISPDEFGENGYETKTLYYYADEILADEHENVVDAESTVGVDSLYSFGRFEPDATYVRNDELRTDFEILLSDDEFPGIS